MKIEDKEGQKRDLEELFTYGCVILFSIIALILLFIFRPT